MFSLSTWHLLFSLFCSLILQAHCDDPKIQTYIVYMGDHPKEMTVAELHHTSMVQRVLGRKFAPETLLHSYKKSFNGFAVRLTQEQAERMAEMDGVISVFPSEKHKLQTTRSWDFIGFPQQVERTNVESDIVVGVIDTGIWPESDSFNDQGFSAPPRKWKGSCQNITCNNKIIGAKYFRVDGFGKDDIISPRDSDGHGTHCASTVAGNWVNSASLYGLGLGTARGGVPSARIAVYKPCWSIGCESADIMAAFDEAIFDGVDILSVSLGPLQVIHRDLFEDVYAIGAFHAMKNGILTSIATNNLGPALFTTTSHAPWMLSVAASTIDRKFFTKVQLGNGLAFEGVSINTFDLQNKTYPLIYSGDAPNITGGFNSSTSRLCLENSLDEAMVKGKIVLCDRLPRDPTGLLSGAVGVVILPNYPTDSASLFGFPLPLAALTLNDGTPILSYLYSTSNPTATIYKSNEAKDSFSPYIASFSSRGPNTITPNVLKPDIAAPGVDIIAAWSPISPISNVKGDKRESDFNIISGTSMACPHASAAAIYVKSFHPTWSPAAIKSALMTTATPMSSALNREAEFAYGAGQINPIEAVNPGLVYDISESDYVRFLCGQGYNAKNLQIITNDVINCGETKVETVWDLNLPSFALKRNISDPFIGVFHRTVTNVGAAASIYKAKVTVPPSMLTIQVTPNVLSFSSVGEKKSFTVTVEGRINVGIVSASLIWDDGNFQVRSPIVVYRVQRVP